MISIFKTAAPLLISLILAACGSETGTVASIQPQLQEMVATKYFAYKEANKLPDDAGLLVHLQTPAGSWTATAGLPAGVNENTHYRIASVSKTFTAAAIMLLDQQGKLRIDDKLTDPIPGTSDPYLPDTPGYAIPFKNQITIRQILSHRAGIYDIFNDPVRTAGAIPYKGLIYGTYIKASDPYHQFTLDELIGVVAANQLFYTDDERSNGYKYSDTGYSILARLVERVAGMSYDRFVSESFLKPIGMSATTSPWNGYDTTIPVPFLKGYAKDKAGFIEFVEDNMSDQVGPGNIISTPSDIATWARTLLSGRGPLTSAQITRMATVAPGNKTYGLGLGNSIVGIGHSGAHPGYVNLVAYNPLDDVSVVVVTPFIDYGKKMDDHLELLTSVALEARRIAGYTAVWAPQ